jgi:hypothetical protein
MTPVEWSRGSREFNGASRRRRAKNRKRRADGRRTEVRGLSQFKAVSIRRVNKEDRRQETEEKTLESATALYPQL